jgi:hypothetical protein
LPSDVFSTAIVLWELASREHPWQEFNYGQFMVKLEADCIAGRRPTIPERTPAGFGALIEAAWHAVPSERPTAGEAAARIDALLPTLARAPPATNNNNNNNHNANNATAVTLKPARAATPAGAAPPPLHDPRRLQLQLSLQSCPLTVVHRATLTAIVSCVTSPTFGTPEYRRELMTVVARTRALLGPELKLFAHVADAFRAPPGAEATSHVVRRRRHAAHRLAALLAFQASVIVVAFDSFDFDVCCVVL